MDSPDKTFSELVGTWRSWIPWRSEPPGVSRDFWMPDKSCRVCYECDSQFTLINRRHHCRLCGRVFCAKCTANSVPVPSSDPRCAREEWEKIRVCNYCFKQWQLENSGLDNGSQVPRLDLCGSPSAASLASSKSSGTLNSSSFTLGSGPYSVGPYQRAQQGAGPIMVSRQSSEMDINSGKQMEAVLGTSNGHVADMGYHSPNQFSFSMNRSDDDEDDYGVSRSNSETRHFPQDNDYFPQLEFDDMSNDEGSQRAHLNGETTDPKSLTGSPINHSFNSNGLESTQNLGKKSELDMDDDCDASSSMYPRENNDSEPVDFENNGLLWLPPEPEDEEDERDALFFDDDDDDDDYDTEGHEAGEWGRLRSSSSFGSGEFRNRDRSTEGLKKAVKNVVDGHFRALVAQLLQVENVPVGDDNDEEGWLEIISSLCWEAATLLKPDMSRSGGMDPGGYVKVKCIASGRRCESMVVKGVVCKKNVAHRRMTTKIEKPRLLILGGALEYQRVSNHLSCFDTLLQQEMDHLKMAVARIDAHQPDVLLVEKSVSRFAQEYLLAKDISLVLNIKKPLLERIARCTGAQIVPSIDHLSSPKLGNCEKFHVERFSEDLGTAGQGGKKMMKTLMYFDGTPKPLGFTILLRGANGDELKKVKHVVQYGVFAAYHLALETSFLADEGASLPEFPLNTPITVALPDKHSSIERSISMVPGFSVPANEKPQGIQEPQRSNSVPVPCLESTISSCSVDQMERQAQIDAFSSQFREAMFLSSVPTFEKKKKMGNFGSIVSEVAESNGFQHSEGAEANNTRDNLSETVTDESSLQHNYKGGVEGLGHLKEEFPPSPSDHQSILVSLSSRCVWKGTVCERSHLFRIKYYGSFDKPLGRFLHDHLFDQNYACQSCEMPSEAHVHCYTHRQGSLTISVKKLSQLLLPGEKDGRIWMWHRCLKCPRINGFPPATRRVVMSDAAWGLSFGKFLELSFSNHAAASRVASCGHSLHRDCLRFYGFGNMVACFRYASISVLSVYLPPAKLDFNYESQDWIRRETNEVVNQAELLFFDVLNALSRISEKKYGTVPLNSSTKLPEGQRLIGELEVMLKKEKSEFDDSVQKMLNREGKPVIDILEVNRLRRQLLFQSYMWDHRLIYAANLETETLQNRSNRPIDPSDLKSNDNPDQSDSFQEKMDTVLDCKDQKHNISHQLDNLEGTPKDDTKALSDNYDESISFSKIPFLNFYRSLNKNFLASPEKLDAMGEYNPVYISSFRDLELQCGARLLLPVGVNDTIVPVYDDEPTSIISYALASPEYLNQLTRETEGDLHPSSSFSESLNLLSFHSFDEFSLDSHKSFGSFDEGPLSMLDPVSYTKTMHARVSFGDDGSLGKVKYSVTCYYAKRFEALRRVCCPSDLDFVRSLSRCKKWGAQGGKSNVFFAKTLDDRFIIKQVTKTELESFIKFAPEYFKYLSESISTRSPTCLAKILGVYQVTSRHLKGGKESKMDVLVMENLLFGRNVTRLYDLKGSSRSRYNPDSSGSNKVLLDQNLIEAMPTSPIFVGNKAKRLLERAVWNDTSFLASIDVMDYSLLVGVDEEKHELVLGIIDFMRQYTWDKHLETWVKASGILGGPKNASPTVISPKQYKKRFRKAMTTYFLMVPDQWSPPTIVPSKSQSDLNGEDSAQGGIKVE